MLDIILWITAFVLIVLGAIGVVFPALPGVPLAFIGFLIGAWINGFEKVGYSTLFVLLFLTILSIILDFLFSVFGAKRMGASFLSLAGATIGTIVGLFFGLAGIFLGPFIGAVIGELYARKDLRQAAKVGIGTWLGLFFGIVFKITTIFVMLGLFIIAYFF